MILTLWIVFVLFALGYYRKPKRKKAASYKPAPADPAKIAAQNERERKQAEKAQIQVEQAESDIGHYTEQLAGRYKMLFDAIHQLEIAQTEVDRDNALNKLGAVTGNKAVKQHIRDRDRYQKQVLTLSQQIHIDEKRKRNAERIIDSAGKT